MERNRTKHLVRNLAVIFPAFFILKYNKNLHEKTKKGGIKIWWHGSHFIERASIMVEDDWVQMRRLGMSFGFLVFWLLANFLMDRATSSLMAVMADCWRETEPSLLGRDGRWKCFPLCPTEKTDLLVLRILVWGNNGRYLAPCLSPPSSRLATSVHGQTIYSNYTLSADISWYVIIIIFFNWLCPQT